MSDFARWSSFKAGSRLAFEKIYQDNASYLYRYGMVICTDRNLVTDTLQDMFVRLWDRRAHIGTTDHIRKYLTTVFKRDLIKEIRKKGKIIFTDCIPEIKQESSDPETCDQQQLNSLIALIRDLSPKQKQIIQLKYFECMDYASICSVMNIKYQSARNLHLEAIKRLQKAIKSHSIQYKFQ